MNNPSSDEPTLILKTFDLGERVIQQHSPEQMAKAVIDSGGTLIFPSGVEPLVFSGATVFCMGCKQSMTHADLANHECQRLPAVPMQLGQPFPMDGELLIQSHSPEQMAVVELQPLPPPEGYFGFEWGYVQLQPWKDGELIGGVGLTRAEIDACADRRAMRRLVSEKLQPLGDALLAAMERLVEKSDG